jgi:hypothetical protein
MVWFQHVLPDATELFDQALDHIKIFVLGCSCDVQWRRSVFQCMAGGDICAEIFYKQRTKV